MISADDNTFNNIKYRFGKSNRAFEGCKKRVCKHKHLKNAKKRAFKK